ncbi:MAG TPA: DUF2286 domain-containing protein [Ignisphaera sp.]|uniref:DUF2286 domain-containing protein n=1 Tax=Ignisphaera aggregans TaxID=334771 RepID=A0A832YYA8_9CREN|nr:DUF2286 domain-containing protein [Ignisphaera sp.]HIP57161.1 DUF2286 domain-containing protein [Ignisphaera aggregans]
MRILILRAEYGEVKEKNVVEGEISSILKDVVKKALELWDPKKSDLIVMRHSHEMQVKLPISKEQYLLYSKFNLRRQGDKAVFEIPLYVISFENQWMGEELVDSKVFIVAPYVDDYTEQELERLAQSITLGKEKEESNEEMEGEK